MKVLATIMGWTPVLLGLTSVACLAAEGVASDDLASELPRVPPLELRDALAAFQVEPGFRIELAAAEPLVHDPVAMAFDERGRLYVVEMRDYSEQDHDFLGVIRLLEDTDGDGRFDQSAPFADKFSWPTAVICYDGGVFVGAAPDIWFLKDTNGDGRADVRRKVLTGFRRDNVQGLLNSFQWGLDNRIHGATSSSGADLRRVDAEPSTAISLRGRDFSFDPRTFDVRAESGGAQHGLCFDDWGRKFVCSNSDHIQLVLFEDRHIARNPDLAAPSARLSIAADGPQAEVYRLSPVEPWRIVRTRLRVAGAVPGPVEGGGRAAGYFTSATGVTIYRGDAWPEAYRGNAFVGDVGSNIVHRKILKPRGVELVAERAGGEQREFVASRDIWFRPAQFANAPDGTLYIADVYREVIEHPDSLPPVIKRHLDLTSGRDRGRIYRVVPSDFQQPKPPRLDQATIPELVAALESENGWRRDTAARLLYERCDPAAVAPLEKLVHQSKSSLGRVHALYALAGLGALDETTTLAGLSDEDSRVRVHAIRLAERLAAASPSLQSKLLSLADDSHPLVRYQLAFALGETPRAVRLQGLKRLAVRDAADRWMRLAILSSLAEGAGELFAALISNSALRASREHRPLLEELAQLVGRQSDQRQTIAAITAIADLPTEDDGGASCLMALARSLGGEKLEALVRDQNLADLAGRLETLAAEARRTAVDPQAPLQQRREAIARLDLVPSSDSLDVLIDLLEVRQPPPVQMAAVQALAGFSQPEVATRLLSAWPTLAPGLRGEVLELLFARPDRLLLVLDAIEAGRLNAGDLDAARVKLLATHPEGTIRERAKKLLAARGASRRIDVIEAYRSALALGGDPRAGRKIFEKHCSLCHKLDGVGHEIGPNLATLPNRGAESILVNVLDPNREVNPQYLNYLLVTAEGRLLTGMIAAETATSVTLTRAQGESDTVLRSDIDTLESSGLSLMPEGLEKDIDVRGMADLIAYLVAVGQTK
jgi:putative membrane-bound dehydrogenase-like protein